MTNREVMTNSMLIKLIENPDVKPSDLSKLTRLLDTKLAIQLMGYGDVHWEDSPNHRVDADYGMYLLGTDPTYGYKDEIPKYSTDYESAFKVIARLKALKVHQVTIQWSERFEVWFVKFSFMEKLYEADNTSLPLAICLAALKCVSAIKAELSEKEDEEEIEKIEISGALTEYSDYINVEGNNQDLQDTLQGILDVHGDDVSVTVQIKAVKKGSANVS